MDRIISQQSCIAATKNQVSGDLLDGEVVILNLKDGVYYGLNSIGSRIWALIQEPRTVREVRDTLLQEYEIEEECCTQELLALLQDLASHELIEIMNGSLA